jgi:2,3-diaminopropionate biosynthesis protein SbnB
MMFSFDLVGGKAVKAILEDSPGRVVDVVQDAYLRHDDGETVNPDSYFLRFPDKPECRIIALPAYIALTGAGVAGLKWVSSFPGNVAEGRPRASAVLVLNDYATGYPIALLEAAGISAARTAASAALAARAISVALPGDGTVSVIGAGVIARTILSYLVHTGYPITELRVHDLDAGSAASLISFAVGELAVPAARAVGLEHALDAQTVVTATTALTPYIARQLRPGQVALGISLRDYTPEVILAAQNYFDDVEHCMKAGTSAHLAEQASGGRAFVSGTLADLVRGRNLPGPDRGVVFSPFGLGVLDIAVGHYVLTAAREQGLAMAMPDFFGETRRW